MNLAIKLMNQQTKRELSIIKAKPHLIFLSESNTPSGEEPNPPSGFTSHLCCKFEQLEFAILLAQKIP